MTATEPRATRTALVFTSTFEIIRDILLPAPHPSPAPRGCGPAAAVADTAGVATKIMDGITPATNVSTYLLRYHYDTR
jgi:hypothetical protein